MTDVVFSFFRMVKEHPDCCDCKHEKKLAILECIEKLPQDWSITTLTARGDYHLESNKILEGTEIQLEIRILIGRV